VKSEQAVPSKRRKSSVCIGCGTVVSGRLSEEHILPKWLRPHVEMKDIKLVHSEANVNEEKVLRQDIIQNFVTRVVCVKCSNGWMSQLELQAKPTLLPLIQGLRSLKSLSTEERLVISRWVFKMSFMIFGVQQAVPLRARVRGHRLNTFEGSERYVSLSPPRRSDTMMRVKLRRLILK
jgi:hypothetical protein